MFSHKIPVGIYDLILRIKHRQITCRSSIVSVRVHIRQAALPQRTSNSSPHSLLPEQRHVLGYFEKQSIINSHDVANILGITARQARALLPMLGT
jgi:hypothetical protein